MGYSTLCYVAVAFLLSQNTSARNLPDFISVCNRNSPKLSQCFKENLQSVGPHLTNGIPEFEILSTSQLVIPSIYLGPRQSSVVNVNVTLKNVNFGGLETYDVIDTKINLDDLSVFIRLHFHELIINCISNAKGKLLNMNLDGEGYSKIKNKDASVTCEWNGEKYSQDGKQHLKLEIRTQRSAISSFEADIEGFFKQNSDADTLFNRTLNENIDLVRVDAEYYMAKLICETLTIFQNQVFGLFSLEQLFPSN